MRGNRTVQARSSATAAGRSRSRKPRKSAAAAGILVLLVGPEARGKDVLIAAARNRYAGNPRIEFPARVATRGPQLDQEHVAVSRREFREIESSSGFAVAWEHFGARHGLTKGALQALQAGRIVVIAAACEAVEDFQALGHAIEVVALQSTVDVARPIGGLLMRKLGAANPGPGERSGQAARAARHQITHSGDIAHAVRRFHAVLDTVQARAGAV
jgi:phosphonate metabolism protein PhnN/1,5-bisphosphokinase (PRPP-forming)